ncbi:MAG TPA: hypothetical protein VKP58_04585 [Candidatus Acidoferrum sp.]|nr:hypothetical protein [Candidatus Acidoferrum sp.]
MSESSGDPFSTQPGGADSPPAPHRAAMPQFEWPKLWIGYLLAAATFLGETIALSRNPDLLKNGQFIVPPLEIFLPAFVARVYWFVCVYQYHKILAAIPNYVHPISPGKAVGFHFIPFFNLYWIFRWPAAMATFANSRLGVPLLRGWVLGVAMICAAICQTFLDAAFGAALLFVATGYLAAVLKRAVMMPSIPQAPLEGS